jgi:ATP-dependent RNA helicase DDX41
MPKEIENYVLRIGRTGRLGKYGLATTFIGKNQDEAILLDLKHLLMESKQNVPGFIGSIPENDDNSNSNNNNNNVHCDNSSNNTTTVLLMECPFCGGLGHKLNQCHKLENQRMKMLQNNTNNVLQQYTSI